MRPPNWLGDAVLALPAMAAIRRHFASAHLTDRGARRRWPRSFARTPTSRPDRVIELPAPTRDAVAALEAERFDLGILFPNSFRSAWQFWRAGIPRALGLCHRRAAGCCSRGAAARRQRAGVRHQADYYRALVRGLGIACDRRRAAACRASTVRAPSARRRCSPSAGVRRRCPLVGIRAGRRVRPGEAVAAGSHGRSWPRVWSRDHDVACVIVGASHDRDARACDRILASRARAGRGRPRGRSGRPHESRRAGRRASTRVPCFVSNDSGAMHLAAALGRPVVAIFGPTDERATRPLGDHDVHHRAGVLPALHVARLSHRSPLHETHLRRHACSTPSPRGSTPRGR